MADELSQSPIRLSDTKRQRSITGVECHLAPPELPLCDGVITLRLPSTSDIAAVAEHAQAVWGLDGNWLPLGPKEATDRHRWLMHDWSRAWAGHASDNGPALLITIPQAAGFVGRIGFSPHAPGEIELDYGIAPRWRGNGFATRATVLATRWLLHDTGARVVELRIARGNHASQRVATNAGYRLVGTVLDIVEATGQTYDDLRYVCSGNESSV